MNYQKALREVSYLIVEAKDPREIFSLITRFLDEEMGVSHASIIVYDKEKDYFVFCDSKGERKVPHKFIKFDRDNPLVQWFSDNRNKGIFNGNYLYIDEIEKALLIYSSHSEISKLLVKLRDNIAIFKSVIAVPGYYNGELIGILLLGKKRDNSIFISEDIEFFQILASDVSISIKNSEHSRFLREKIDELSASIREIQRLRQKDRDKFLQTILTFSKLVDARDPYTFGHSEEVEKLGMLTAEELELEFSEEEKQCLSTALLLHDIGKIGIADKILHKNGKLDKEEWILMQDHPRIGASILEKHDDFKEISRIILHHHENYDGTGYPSMLIGEEIPIESRIISVVDAFHAMVSDRPYRKGLPGHIAINEIIRCSGKQFDPKVVDAFVRAWKKLKVPQ